MLPRVKIIIIVLGTGRQSSDTLTDSYIHTARCAGKSLYILQTIAVESLGPVNLSAVSFLSCLGRRVAEV